MYRQLTFVVFLFTTIGLVHCQSGFAQRNNSYENYAKGVIKKYDSNQNGTLDRREIRKMRRPFDFDNVDSNGDLHVSDTELISYISRISSDRRSDERSASPKQVMAKIPRAVHHQVDMNLVRIRNSSRSEIQIWINEIAKSEETVKNFLESYEQSDAAVVAALSSVVPTGFECRMSHNIGNSNHPEEVNLSFVVEKTTPNTVVNVSVNSSSDSDDDILKFRRPNGRLRTGTTSNNRSDSSPKQPSDRSVEKDRLEKMILERIEEKRKQLERDRDDLVPTPISTPIRNLNSPNSIRFESKIVCNNNGESLTYVNHRDHVWLMAFRVTTIGPERDNRDK